MEKITVEELGWDPWEGEEELSLSPVERETMDAWMAKQNASAVQALMELEGDDLDDLPF